MKQCEFFECQKCEHKFTQAQNLKQHVNAVHLKIRNFECQKCEQKFSAKGSLRRHTMRAHEPSEVKREKCEFCTYSTIYKSELKHHVDTVHLKIYNFMCQQCENKFPTMSKLRRHAIKVHEQIIKYECDKCEYAVDEHKVLRRHIWGVHKVSNDRFESNKVESNKVESNRVESNKVESNRVESKKDPHDKIQVHVMMEEDILKLVKVEDANKEKEECQHCFDKNLRISELENQNVTLQKENATLIRDLSVAKEYLEAERRLREELEEDIFVTPQEYRKRFMSSKK